MFSKIVTLILNFIVAPIFGVLFVIWKIGKKLLSDVMSHMYAKILISTLALIVLGFILKIF